MASGKEMRYNEDQWAYSSAVERVHGMDEVGVRLPVGPQTQCETRPTAGFALRSIVLN